MVFHGYAEHGGRYRHVGHAIADGAAIAATAPDFRGHGNSSGPRGYVQDFKESHLACDAVPGALPPGPPRLILGHSHGALIGFDWLEARHPPIKAIAVTNPFLAVAMPVPAVKLWASKFLLKFAP